MSFLSACSQLQANVTTTEEYLSTHYELLREDAVRRLRDAVTQVKLTPAASEDAFNGAIGIYEKACHEVIEMELELTLF